MLEAEKVEKIPEYTGLFFAQYETPDGKIWRFFNSDTPSDVTEEVLELRKLYNTPTLPLDISSDI